MGNFTNPAYGSDAARVESTANTFTAGESEVIDTKGNVLLGCFLPTGGATAATLTFKACATADGAYVDVKDAAGAALSVTVSTSAVEAVAFGPTILNQLAAFRYIQLVNAADTGAWTINTRFIE